MSFEQYFSFLRCYILILQYYGVFVEFMLFPSFAYGYVTQNENPEITENLYFEVYKAQIHVDLYFDHYFNFLSVKTDKNEQGLDTINVEVSKAFKNPNTCYMISNVAE